MCCPVYESTRGSGKKLTFLEAVKMGLAEDGGLYVPNYIPRVSQEERQFWRSLSYEDLCFKIMRKFIDVNEIPNEALSTMIHKSYNTNAFRVPNCVAFSTLSSNINIIELFHGITYAFKDFALQFLGRLFEYILQVEKKHIVILGATSGDTGSAAIAGFRGIQNVDCFILFPKGRTSRIQELQMTTILDTNVQCISVENATFDDCQNLVKDIFASPLKQYNLTAANSINWARILAQIVYYWYTCLQVNSEIDICVPTGNFGNVLVTIERRKPKFIAAFYAREMGAPIRKLIIASNENDILTRFCHSGKYMKSEVHATISPSMDIQISSNFERLLFELLEKQSDLLSKKIYDLAQYGEFNVDDELLKKFHSIFAAYKASENETTDTIRFYGSLPKSIILDPHTAVGVCCAKKYLNDLETSSCCKQNLPMFVAATAHFGKFVDTLREILDPALIDQHMPKELSDLVYKPRKVEVLPCNKTVICEAIQNFITRKM